MTKRLVTFVTALLLVATFSANASGDFKTADYPNSGNTPSVALKLRLISDTNFLVDGIESSVAKGTLAKFIANPNLPRTGDEGPNKGYEKYGYETVLKKMKVLQPDWPKNKSGSQDWCAWTVSFLLRGQKVHDKDKALIQPSSSYFLNSVMRQGGTVITEPSNNVKYLKDPSGNLYKAQAGDLIFFYGNKYQGEGPEERKTVKTYLDSEIKKKGQGFKDGLKHFDHMAIVVAGNVVLEGNRSERLRLNAQLPKDTENRGFIGFVIVRPKWPAS